MYDMVLHRVEEDLRLFLPFRVKSPIRPISELHHVDNPGCGIVMLSEEAAARETTP